MHLMNKVKGFTEKVLKHLKHHILKAEDKTSWVVLLLSKK